MAAIAAGAPPLRERKTQPKPICDRYSVAKPPVVESMGDGMPIVRPVAAAVAAVAAVATVATAGVTAAAVTAVEPIHPADCTAHGHRSNPAHSTVLTRAIDSNPSIIDGCSGALK